MKKQLLLLITLLLPMIASADAVEINGFYYNLIEKAKAAELTENPNKYSGDIVVPETVIYENVSYTVTAIDKKAFINCETINTVKLPNSITNIGQHAFYGCSNLISITLSSSLTSIGDFAFAECTKLTHIDIPNSVKDMGNKVFFNCSSLTNLTIGNNLTSIGEFAFCKCSSLKSVSIPNSVASVARSAFNSCSGLTSLTLGTGLISIGESAFQGCKGLTTLIIPNNVSSIDLYAFQGCTGITSLTISSGIANLKEGVFSNCSSLQTVTIPDGMKEIGNFAFSNCTSLSSIVIPPSVTFIGGATFNNCSALTEVHISDLSAWCNIGYYADSYNPLYYAHHLFLNGEEIKDLVIPEDVTKISNFAFSGCSGLISLTIPDKVTSIGERAFTGCSGLVSVNLPNSIKSISTRLFYDCNSLKTITIPNGVTSIGEMAFKGCSKLTSVIIPKSVTYINKNAFTKCKELTDFYCYATNVPKTGEDVFKDSYTEYATLHVPGAVIDDYKVAKPWSNFKNFVALIIQKYVLQYLVDGEVFKSYSIEEDETITPEPEPTKEGYTFSGWSEIPKTMPAHDVTITGTFTINKYKLVYKVDDADYKTLDVEFGADITPEAAPTKEGYSFSGWSEIPETMPAHDVTVTGSFAVNKYKLIYKIDDADYKTFDVEFGATITPEAAPTKEGYTFSGWSEIPGTMPAHDVTVTGTFAVNKYQLIYKVDGEVYKTYEVEYGTEITPEPTPEKEGWTFSGWSSIPSKMPAEDVTITGTFTQNQYETEGGTYVIDDDGATIVKGEDKEGEVVIKTTIIINGKTYHVTVIGEAAFKGCTKMSALVIPDAIKAIRARAFEGCSRLRNIIFGKGISAIGHKAFANIGTASGASTRSADGLKVSCTAETVPTADTDVFENTDVTNATLVVNDNLVNSYKTTSPWSQFGSIIGFNEASGIDVILSDQQGAAIYSIDGRRMDNAQKGLNVIRTSDGRTRKVIIK